MKGQKLSTKLGYRHFAEITFSEAFPIDMLRYDSCYPVSETDSNEIINSLNPMIDSRERKVLVARLWDSSQGAWSLSRWESYHCKVEQVDAEYQYRRRDPMKTFQVRTRRDRVALGKPYEAESLTKARRIAKAKYSIPVSVEQVVLDQSDAQRFPQAEENVDPGLEVVKNVFDGMTLRIPVDELREEHGKTVSDDQFRAHISRLVDLYLETYRDDEGVDDNESLRGTVEQAAKDFGIFVDALDGEVPTVCPHGTPLKNRCEECIAEGKYTHAQPYSK